MFLEKYSRHAILSEIGKNGQDKISNSKIVLVGAGGIGSPILIYLSLAGVAKIAVVDDDFVEESNLQRQIVFSKNDIDKNKAVAAKENLANFYGVSNIESYPQKFTRELGDSLIAEYDIIIDATDDLKTKFLLNELALKYRKIFVSGSFLGWKGYYSVYKSEANYPCFACFHGDELELKQERACYNKGVVAPAVATIGTMIATEVIKEICNAGETLTGNIMFIDFLKNKHRLTKLLKREDCKYCGR